MKVTVTAHHVEVTKALKEYATKKLEKLVKYFDNIQHIDVHLKVEDNAKDDERQVVEVNLKASKTLIRATDMSSDMYASLDMVHDKLEMQLTKHKEKLRDRSARQKHQLSKPAAAKADKHDEDNLYIPKPMTPEDAATLYENGQPFLMFNNSDTGKVNVLYTIDDGHFGLIEP